MLNNLLEVLRQGNNTLFYKINDEEITYQECYEKVLELSNNLKKQGNGSVIIYGDKSINTVIAILSCIVAKRCYIPIYTCTPLYRIEDIISKMDVTLIINDHEINIDNIECLSVEDINTKYQDINKYYESTNKYAYTIFTSGSTVKSKGVPISYDNLNHFINWVINLEEYKECNNIKVLSQASFSFDLSVMDLYFSIYKNNSIIGISSCERNDLLKVYRTIQNNEINFLIMTPTFIKMLLIDKEFNEEKYPSIKYMFFCGELLEVSTVKKIRERFNNVRIINAYGPTEATCFVTQVEIMDNMLSKEYLPVGKINTSAVDISIRNNVIVLKGGSVFDGYLDVSSNTYYQEDNINTYNTGDIGLIKDNYLYCKGRIDNQIKYMGYRIELGDIENNLLKIDGIKEAVVICKYKEDNIVKLIKGYVTINKNIDTNYIKKELAKLIPIYMVPKTIEIIEEIPINNNGKYDRRKLSEL